MQARVSGLTLIAVLLSLTVSSTDVSAQQRSRRGRDLFGDWQIKMDFNGREWESILAFSRNREGNRSGQWITFFGVTDLKDVTFEDGKLSFVHERRNRSGDTVTSNFSGSIADGKLTGTLSNDRGELRVEGSRSPRIRRAAGNWETKFSIGEREITNKLVITTDKEGKLAVDWQSDRVKHEISDIRYERGRLTFKTNSTMDDRSWESNFEAAFERGAFAGTIKSDRGERPVKGTLIGTPLIGTWNLDISSERGERKQRLRVFPDMSGLYGPTPVEKVELEDDNVSFKISFDFGDNPFEISFQGKIEGSSLQGKLTSPRGTRQVTGQKAPRIRRRGRPASD